MIRFKGLMRAIALAISLVLLMGLSTAAAAEPDTLEPDTLVSTEESIAESPDPEPAAEKHEPQSAPETNAQLDLEAFLESEPSAPPASEAPETKHNYDAAWADGAFRAQTVNYVDELIIGLGASYQIDSERDIQLINEGVALGNHTDIQIDYDTSNAKYISVNKSGRIHGEKKGSAQVCVTVQLPDGTQKQLRQNVKVVEQPTISFAPDYAILENGGKLDLGQYAKVPLLKASPNVDAGVRYEIAPRGKAGASKVSLDKNNGKLSVKFQEPGDQYIVTAVTYGGQKASFTLYLGQRATRVDILVNPNAMQDGGRLAVKSGQSEAFKAVAYDENGKLAARQDIRWSLEGNDDVAAINEQGVLSVVPQLETERTIEVVARAVDGSDSVATFNVVAIP